MRRLTWRIYWFVTAAVVVVVLVAVLLVGRMPVPAVILICSLLLCSGLYGAIYWGLIPYLRTLEELTVFLHKIPGQRFTQRLYHDPLSEAAPFVRALNQLLDQIEIQLNIGEEYRQRLNSLLENMASGVMLLDPRGRILLVNAMAERLLGSSRKELIGRQHIAASHHYELGQLIDRCLQSGERYKQELTVYYPQERILDVHLSPIPRAGGGKGGVVVVMHDITEIRRLERLRSEFVANVSHELRTPLTAVKGFAETLLDGAMHEPETLQAFLKIILHESDRLHRMIGELLDLSKIEFGQVKLDFRRIHLKEHLEDVLRLVQVEAEERQLTLQLHVADDPVIEADPDRFRQILLNLLSNAIAYTPPGGRIDLMAESHPDGTWVRVRDTGIGIPEEDLPHLFERFYRVDKARSRESGGTGLGLAIVKHLVEAHHGMIEVKSELGRGSQFSVFFPARQPDRQE